MDECVTVFALAAKGFEAPGRVYLRAAFTVTKSQTMV